VIRALLEALGEHGTLMMPTHTTDNSDPAEWQHPPVPERWWQIIRDNMPAYDPAVSRTRQMGAVPELFRTFPGVLRSDHPVTSFAAYGPNAVYLTADHVLEHDTGDRSPVGRLYELDGNVLLLGVEHWNNTSLHLAEFRANYKGKRNFRSGCAMKVEGRQQWVWYETLFTHSDDFGAIGQAFDAAQGITIGRIVNAEVRLFKQRTLVDFAIRWMEENRDLSALT
jgi:aminoglycoside 3-N-acetyltransferase